MHVFFLTIISIFDMEIHIYKELKMTFRICALLSGLCVHIMYTYKLLLYYYIYYYTYHIYRNIYVTMYI